MEWSFLAETEYLASTKLQLQLQLQLQQRRRSPAACALAQSKQETAPACPPGGVDAPAARPRNWGSTRPA